MEKAHKNFVAAIEKELVSKQSHNKRSITKLAASFGIDNPNTIKELTELAIVNQARKLAHAPGTIHERYNNIVQLYKTQVNLSHRTSQSILLQQYSTPAPIGYLMGVFCGVDKFTTNQLALEPSAGNGLLTIAGNPENFVVNEIDDIRYENLKTQDFSKYYSFDSSQPLNKTFNYQFDAIITNPPFGRLDAPINVNGYSIAELDHIMAIYGLQQMKASGKAAIIIGAHTKYDGQGRVQAGKNRIFLSYLYHFYNVVDIIPIEGSKLYSRQGTSFDTRLILINGRKETPGGFPPLNKTGSDEIVNDFEDLFNRIMSHTEEKNNKPGLDKIKAKAIALKLKLMESTGLGMAYTPGSKNPNVLRVETPDSMGTEIHRALEILKQQVGSIDEFVKTKLKYSSQDELYSSIAAEQIDGVALDIFNIEQKGQAIIIADQTGIGKGRQAAAIIRYGVVNGMQPIFITEKPNLFSDLYRDLSAIGGKDYVPFIVNSNEDKTKIKDENGVVVYEPIEAAAQKKIIDSQQLSNEFNYVLLTYSQIRDGNFDNKGTLLGKSPKGQFIEAIAKKNIFILDESHNASGESNSGKILQDILAVTKGGLFLSATFAKRPDNMPLYAAKTAIQEAALTKTELIEAIEKGGVALQEVVSAQLVEAGQLIRRERNFEGIEVNYITLDEKASEHKAIYDNLTQVIRDIIEFQNLYIDPEVAEMDSIMAAEYKEVEQRRGTRDVGVSNSPAFSKCFQLVNQMLLCIKADAVAEKVLIRLREGKAPVIAFSNTMGSFLEQMMDESGTPVTINSTVNADFGAVLMRALNGTLRYTVTDVKDIEEKTDQKGSKAAKKQHKNNVKYEFFDITTFSAEAQAEYLRIAEVIKSLASGLVISPIDLIKQKIEKEGYKVAEVTGRSLGINIDLDRLTNKNQITGIIYKRKKENTSDAFRKFNNNEVDVLMINQSGSTGASAHAIVTKNVPASQVKQRVMSLLQAELDINTEVQKRGRINRTGQIKKPIYDYVFSAIPAEKRLSMILQKKLKSLDANTTSNQKNSEALLKTDDFLNKYGDNLVYEYLAEYPNINKMIGDPLGLLKSTEDGGTNERQPDAANRVAGRIAILPTDMQNQFYNEMLQRYADLVEDLRAAGEYDLEVEYMDLQAKQLSEPTIAKGGKGGFSPFGDNTYIEKHEVNILHKPYTPVELQNILNAKLQEKTPEQYMQELTTDFETFTEKGIEAFRTDINEKYAKLLAKEIDPDKKDDLEAAKIKALNTGIDSRNNYKRIVLNMFRDFVPGKYYKHTSWEQSDKPVMYVFTGYNINKNAPNPYTRSAIKLNFAVASSRKKQNVPLSNIEFLNSLLGESSRLPRLSWDEILEQWTVTVKEGTKDRGIKYIVTGNLLQGFSMPEFKNGKLVQFSTIEGQMRKGLLLENFTMDSANAAKQFVPTMPIYKARKAIAAVSDGSSVIFDGLFGSYIAKNKYGNYDMIVSKSRKISGDIFLDKDLLKHMDGNVFNTVSNTMKATFDASQLNDVCKILQDKHNLSVRLQPWQMQLVQDEIKANKFSDVVQPIPAKFTEAEPAPPAPLPEPIPDEKTPQTLKLLKFKAKAIALKLKLLQIA